MNLIKALVEQRNGTAPSGGGSASDEAGIKATDVSNKPASTEMPVTKPVAAFSAPAPQAAPKSPAPKVWELFDDLAGDDVAPKPSPAVAKSAAAAPQHIDATDPLTPRQPRHAGRVKTRLLGFNNGGPVGDDVFNKTSAEKTRVDPGLPVGWLVVIKGPGRGTNFALTSGVSLIGRGEDQTIRLNFGDDSISRNQHAAIAFDEEQNVCFLGHGSKANLVRLNGHPVLSTELLSNADTIRVGETTLRYVALCGPDFSWDTSENGDERHETRY